MFSPLLKKIISRENLTRAEAASLLEFMISSEATDAQIAAALIALAVKGETEEELAGFAETMRSRCTRIATKHAVYLDTCGTGGSGAKTFNVSTAAAFVVAAAGIPVAKHGNVGVTSKSGSADVLRALGVKVDLTPDRVMKCLDEIGICFMFAPLHHGATKRVAMVRRELGVRTIFNLLGPLTNPAGVPHQVIGVSDEKGCEKVARALAMLGTKKSWIVRGSDGLDEITLTGPTVVYEADEKGVRSFEITPEEFGLSRASIDDLRGGTAEENAVIIQDILSGSRQDAARDLVLMNAAASIYVSGLAQTLQDSFSLAQKAITSGQALSRLRALQNFTQLN
ncbi:MAG TPA: anthranilate phosphoribosyltransferase [Blastocatellia bacterium]|nr:anthranilate phosphoribosyltransferase [Blastocatellia bacterium]